jgi:ABC-type glycerol-3-phosphate transport system substrate-binding protein
MDWATETVFYNKDLVEKAGYTADDINTLSWNANDGGTFQKVVEHLTIDKNGVRGDEAGFDAKNVATYGIGNQENTGDPFGQGTWGVLLTTDGINIPNKQNWATELRYGDPKVAKALKNIKSLSTQGFAPQFNQFTSAGTDQLTSGQVAMTLGGTWEAATYASLPNFHAGVAPVPTGSDGKRHLWSNSNGNVISASGKHPDQTWKWVSYQESEACQTKSAQVNGSFLPSIGASLDALTASQKSKGVDFSVFTNYVKNNELIPSPVYNNGAAIQNAVVPQFEAFFTGKSDESIFPKMQEQAKTLLASK